MIITNQGTDQDRLVALQKEVVEIHGSMIVDIILKDLMIEVVQDLLNVLAKSIINHLEGIIDLDQKIGIKIQLTTTLNATKKTIVLDMLKKVKSIDIRTKVVAVITMNIEVKRKVKSITEGLDLDD